MANNEFNNIEQFIEGFTRTDDPVYYTYDGYIFGMEFMYKERIYRITREPIGTEKKLKEKFGQDKSASIKLFEIPVEEYPEAFGQDLDKYLGIYEDVYDLLDNGKIDGIPLRDIIASGQTQILAID